MFLGFEFSGFCSCLFFLSLSVFLFLWHTLSLSLKTLCGGVNGGSEVNIFEGILGSEIRAPWRLCFWLDRWFSPMGRAGSFPFHLIFLYCFSFAFSSFKLFFLLFHIWQSFYFFHGVDYYFYFIGSCKFRCHSLHVIHIFCLKIRNPKKSINETDCVMNG